MSRTQFRFAAPVPKSAIRCSLPRYPKRHVAPPSVDPPSVGMKPDRPVRIKWATGFYNDLRSLTAGSTIGRHNTNTGEPLFPRVKKVNVTVLLQCCRWSKTEILLPARRRRPTHAPLVG